MSTNTAIKTWQERYNENGGSVEDCANAEIAELRAALEKSAEELEEWRFTNKVDELQRENERLRAALEAANHRIEDLTTAANRCINDALGMASADQQREAARNESLFIAACEDLGAINEHLGLDPDDGGAEPIIAAIDELRAVIAQRAGSGEDVIGDLQAEARQQKLDDFIASGVQPDSERDAARLDFLQTVLERNEYGPRLYVAGRNYEAETIREVLDVAMAAQQGEKGD